MRTNSSPGRQLASFLGKYDPAIAARARASIALMRKRLSTATELVYDNYNALAIGFGPSDRASEAIFSIGGSRAPVTGRRRRLRRWWYDWPVLTANEIGRASCGERV